MRREIVFNAATLWLLPCIYIIKQPVYVCIQDIYLFALYVNVISINPCTDAMKVEYIEGYV